MPYTMDDFRREVALGYLDQLTPDEILQRLSADEIKAYLAKLQKGHADPKPRKPKRARNRSNPDR